MADPAEALGRLAEARPNGDRRPLPQFRLAIPGTSARQLRELEAQAGLEGWLVLRTTTMRKSTSQFAQGYSAVFIATDDAQRDVAQAINAALPSLQVDVGRLEPITPAALFTQLRAIQEHRGRFTTGRFVDAGKAKSA
jgi:hypothetical protein